MNPEPPLSSRYYTLLVICCSIVLGCYVGTYMRFPVVPLFAQSLGADTTLVGMINAAFLLAAGAVPAPGPGRPPPGDEAPGPGPVLLMLAASSFLLAVSSTPHQLIWIYLFSGAGLALLSAPSPCCMWPASPRLPIWAGPTAGTPRRSMSA